MKEFISDVFTLCFLVSFCLLIIGLARPSLFAKYSKKLATRKRLSAIFGGAFILFFVLTGITVPGPLENLYDLDQAKELQVSFPADMDQLEAAIVVQNGLSNLITSFVEARLDMEIIVSEESAKLASTDRNTLYDETMVSLKKAEEAQQSFVKQIDLLFSEKLISSGRKYPNFRFFETANAEGLEEVSLTGHSTGYKFEDVILALHDKAPNRQKLQAVADEIGSDIKTAHEVMRLIHAANHAESLNDLEVATRYRDAAQVLATGSKVLVTIAGVAAAGPTLAVVGAANPLVGAVEIGAIGVSGADTVLEVAETGVQIAMKDSKEKDAMATLLHDAREWKPLKYADTVISIYDLTKAPGAMAKLLDKRAALLSTTMSAGKRAKWAAIKDIRYNKAFEDLMATLSGNMVSIEELFIEGDDQIVIMRNGDQTYVAPMENFEYVRKAYENGVKLSPADLKRMFQRADQDSDFDLSMQQLGLDYLTEFDKQIIKPKPTPAPTKPAPVKKTPTPAKPAPAQPPAPVFAPIETPTPEPDPEPTPTPEPAPEPAPEPPPAPVDACAGATGCEACWCKGQACVCGYDSCACE